MAHVIVVDAADPDPGAIAEAAALIRAGELVAFPTETVYGLGANALEPAAVAKIFTAKGRPATNPVIVHVSSIEEARSLTVDWTPNAAKLAARFWPGPLTLVVKKAASVPEIVTAGGDTVALRVPDHGVALALLKASGVPVAAPSANRSTELSPTRAEHVVKSLADRIPLILDGGPCRGGIESTVVDATGERVRILRPGLIDAATITTVLDAVETITEGGIARSPGQMERHYSPKTPLYLAHYDDETRLIGLHADWGITARFIHELTPALGPAKYAAILYETLHRYDGQWDSLIVAMPPDRPEWQAIRDRLARAAVREGLVEPRPEGFAQGSAEPAEIIIPCPTISPAL